jgi:hypothetical protein
MFGELNDEILVFALGTDHALWVRARVGGVWRAWDSLGHTLASPPSAVTWQNETFAVFALGVDSAVWANLNGNWHVFGVGTDSAIWRRRWVGDSWSDWHSLHGVFTGPPATSTRVLGDGAFPTRDLAGLGSDHTIWHMEEQDT